MQQEEYIEINRENWNKRASIHVETEFYAMPAFKSGKNSLNPEDVKLLGDVKGLSVLHLQCHFGQDTISLSRMGAKATGVDLSDTAISLAEKLSQELGTDTRFIRSDVYNLPKVHDEKYDIVYTSYGTIGWLPDIDAWAKVVSHFVKPGGRFIFVEFHPFLWSFDNSFEKIHYDYFKGEPIIESETGTYADIKNTTRIDSVTWNHGLAEVMQALIDNGLQIEHFGEYDHSPYNIFPNGIEIEPGKFKPVNCKYRIPIVYSISARKL